MRQNHMTRSGQIVACTGHRNNRTAPGMTTAPTSALVAAALATAASPASAEAPPGHYLTSADTVIDTGTGLEWQRTVVDGAYYAFSAAESYCSFLVLGGHDDWRLPTIAELASLLDPSRVSPAIDPAAFPRTPPFGYWSSTAYRPAANAGWIVYFDTGNIGYSGRFAPLQVRCVR